MTRSRTAALFACMAIAVAACASDATSSGPHEPSGSPPAGATSTPSAEPSPSGPPSPTAEPSGAGAPLSIAWEEAEAFDGQVLELFADGGTWIAGGWDPKDGPVAWTSTDARTWMGSDVENQQPDETFAGPQFGPMARLGDSLLSFGTFIGCCDGRGVYGWRSADGTSWDAIESTSPLFEEGYLVTAIAAAESTLVAVEVQYVEFASRFWTWTEDTSWLDTTPNPGAGPFSSGIHLNDVAWSGDRFVAVGARGDGERREPPTGTSWASTDGRSWEASAPNDAMNGVSLSAIAPLPDGSLVALGYPDPLEGTDVTSFAFRSPDGLAWTAAPEPFPGSTVGPFADLVEVPGGLVAFSGRDVWATSDGMTWTQAGSLDAPFVTAAAMDDEIVVITADFDQAMWAIQRGVIGR